MTTETPQQRRTRLIEQYTGLACATVDTEWGAMLPQIEQVLHWSTRLADAVIAATPQAQEPAPTRYPGEVETRLIELLESEYPAPAITIKERLAAIKRDLGIV